MAFPQVAAVNGGYEDPETTSHTVNMPSGLSSGDLAVALFAADGNPTVSWPEGWTELDETANGSDVVLSIAYRVADGGEGASITVTTSASEMSAHTSFRITGFSGTPEVGTAATDSDDNPDPPSLTPTWGALDTLWIACYGMDADDGVDLYPTNYSNGRQDLADDKSGCHVGSARRELNASSENPGTFDISGSAQWVAQTIAVKPVTVQTISPDGIASAEAFGTSHVKFTLEPSGVATAEAFGTSQVDLKLEPSGVASTEAFGTSQLNLKLEPSAIASAEAFGTAAITVGTIISPDGIASAEAFGTSQLNLKLEPSGIATAEAFGTPTITLYLIPGGIASLEALGTPQLDLKLEPSGIASAEAFGTTTLVLYLLPSSIASAETFGTVSVSLNLAPSGISSLEAFGSPQLDLNIACSGIASSETFGTTTITLYLLPSGIGTQEALGTPQVNLKLEPSGIASAEAFGTALVALTYILTLYPDLRDYYTIAVKLRDYYHMTERQ